MRCEAVNRNPRVRRVVAVLTAAWMALWVVVIGAHYGSHSNSLYLELVPPGQPQALATSPRAEFVLDADHRHLDGGSPADHNEPTMAVGLPWSSATLVTGGVVTMLVAVAAWLNSGAMLAGQGSHGSADVFAGQELLTRFCLSRR